MNIFIGNLCTFYFETPGAFLDDIYSVSDKFMYFCRYVLLSRLLFCAIEPYILVLYSYIELSGYFAAIPTLNRDNFQPFLA